MNALVRKIFYALPVNLRYTARRLLYLPQDIFRDKNNLVPPKGKIFIGRGDFKRTGEAFFNYFKEYGLLTPQSRILDVGSGIGRMAVPFTNFLDENGVYDGFDIVEQGVEWCTKNISSKFPNFIFKWTPLKNDLYNLDTNDDASQFKFPYPDEHYDFVFLTSVFTHMLPKDVENYISEIHRVLKKDKICFASFFVLDEESEQSMFIRGSKSFKHSFGDYSVMDKNVLEANVAYKKEYIYKLMESRGFEITHFMRGYWSGANPTGINEHQDHIIFKKK
jgi:SAM-dependent methyltransferase